MDKDCPVFLDKVISFLPYYETMTLKTERRVNQRSEKLLHIPPFTVACSVLSVLPQGLVLEFHPAEDYAYMAQFRSVERVKTFSAHSELSETN